MSSAFAYVGDPTDNPMGTDGFAFLEFAPRDPEHMVKDFQNMGFTSTAKHQSMDVMLYQQGDIAFFINSQPDSMAQRFARVHGPAVSAMGFRVQDPQYAYQRALRLGARAYQGERGPLAFPWPAIYGIGESLLYFVGVNEKIIPSTFVTQKDNPQPATPIGLTYLDHVTHNVFQGQMNTWADYYHRLFNFREIRYFDIKGEQTGLTSRALTSPCNKIRIPLNQSSDDKSQIVEYLNEYNGEGIQHIALGCTDIYHSVETMRLNNLLFLTVPKTYYEQINDRVLGHTEDLDRLAHNKILIDGNATTQEGILLQIFTRNMIGPVFFEIIQRKGNEGFGEGNFRALFVAMELDQIRRGVLKAKEM